MSVLMSWVIAMLGKHPSLRTNQGLRYGRSMQHHDLIRQYTLLLFLITMKIHEIAANYIQEMLNMALEDRMVFFSFAMPSKRSGDAELSSHGPVFVTGVLYSPDILRLRAVRFIFPANHDLSVIWTLIMT
jgi:hypothetical protein